MQFDIAIFTDLFFYVARYFIAVNIFLFPLAARRKYLIARYFVVSSLLIGIIIGYQYCTAAIMAADFNTQTIDILLELRYASLNLLIFVCMLICYKTRLVNYLFAFVCGDIFQNLATLFTKPFNTIIDVDNGVHFLIYFIVQFFLCGIIFIIEWFVFVRKLKIIGTEVIEGGWKNCCFYLFLFSELSLLNITLYYVASVIMTGVEIAIYISLAIVNIGILLFMFENLNVKKANIEQRILEQLIYEKEKQYMMSKENIEIINCKCHDLKRQIEALSFSSEEDRQTIVSELKEAVNIYDSSIKTTNTTLNILLTEKSLLCEKNHIKFSCIADGESLDYISAVDLYLLLGNALDNAIENSVKIENCDNRTISLVIERRGKMTSIQMNNNYEGEIVSDENGRLITSKANSDYHGYGLKSMEYIVKKYGGSIFVGTSDGIFILQILLP